MVGLNQNFRKVFVTTNNTLLASGTTTNLAAGQLGIFNSDTYVATNAPNWATAKGILIAQGTEDLSAMPKGAGIRNETDKTKTILGHEILRWRTKAYQAGQTNIMTIGWDGVNGNKDTKNMTVKCDEIKHLYIRLTGKPIENLVPGGYLLHVEANGPCCDNCGDSCDSVDPTSVRDEFYDRIIEHTFLGGIPLTKYVTVTKLTTTNTAGDPCVGLQFESGFVERTSDACYFDLFPYNSDPIHIQLSEWNPDWHGTPERCTSTYPIMVIQDVAYPAGAGEAVMRYEAYGHGWDNRDYNKFDIALRKAEGQHLYTDPSLNYDLYQLTYRFKYKVLGWSDVYTDTYDIDVFVPTGQTGFKTAVNTYIASVTGLGVATL